MAKVKVLKKLPKQKKFKRKQISSPSVSPADNKFKDNYFKFYDDIKHPTHQHYDW